MKNRTISFFLALVLLLCPAALAAEPASIGQGKQYRGEGTVIAIIDSGFDTGHALFALSPAGEKAAKLRREDLPPEFQDRYVNAKIPYAYDYADGDGDVFPYDWQENEAAAKFHGTHVAGIAGANGLGDASEGRFDGAAPEAQLLLMKVMSDKNQIGQQEDEAVFAAVEDAIALGADVINLSLGDPGTFYLGDGAGTGRPDYSALSTRCAQAGVLLVASAGNDRYVGQYDFLGMGKPRYDQSDYAIPTVPAQADFVTSVASRDRDRKLPTLLLDGEERAYLDYTARLSLPSGAADFQTALGADSAQAVYVGLGRLPGDSTASPEANDYAGQDLTGKLAGILRGDINFALKCQNAQTQGAVGVVLLNSETGANWSDITLNLDGWNNPAIPLMLLDYQDGQTLTRQIVQTGALTLGKNTLRQEGTMSSFSTWGGTTDLRLTPSITALGENIYSTMPRADRESPTTAEHYGLLSGTSMASPSLAGYAARVCQYVGENAAKFGNPTGLALCDTVNTILCSTAIPQPSGTLPASPRQQGAGLADVEGALKTDVVLFTREKTPKDHYYTGTADTHRVTKADLGEIAEGTQTISFCVSAQNYGRVSHTYDLGLSVFSDRPEGVDVGGGRTIWYVSGQSVAPRELKVNYYGDGVSGESITIPAREERTFTVSVSLPYGTEEDYDLKALMECSGGNGFYVEGFLTLTGRDGAPDLSLPYMGYYGDWGKAPIFDVPLYGKAGDDELPHYWDGYGASAILVKGEGDAVSIAGRNTLAGPLTNRIEGKYAAASPKMGELVPSFILLRSVKSMSYELYDEEGRRVADAFDRTAPNYAGTVSHITKSAVTASPLVSYRYETLPVTGELSQGWYTLKLHANLESPHTKTQQTEMSFYVDTTAPVFATAPAVTVAEGTASLSYEAVDNHFIQGVLLTAEGKTQCVPYPYAEGAQQGSPIAQSVVVDDSIISGASPVTVTLLDYAGNHTTAQLAPWCFSDVPKGANYEQAANALLVRGIMNGVGDGRFDPQATMTGSMWELVLARWEGDEPIQVPQIAMTRAEAADYLGSLLKKS